MKERDAHETYRTAARRLHWYALGLLGTLLVIVLAMYWLARPLMQRAAGMPAPTPPPAPRLQAHPQDDLAALRRRETQKLQTYEWIDRSSGVARIPIERAMQLLAESAVDARRASFPPASPAASPGSSASQEAPR